MVKQRYEKSQSSYKLIIMDLYLPDVDGFKASEKIFEFLRTKFNEK